MMAVAAETIQTGQSFNNNKLPSVPSPLSSFFTTTSNPRGLSL